MKTSTVLSKTLALTFLFIGISACNEITPIPAKSSKGENFIGGDTSGSGGGAGTLPAPSVLRVKNYNQYNMTLEKLTGVSRATVGVSGDASRPNIAALFDEIKGSMPADNEIAAMTPFNLVSMTRLSDAYCTHYVNGLPAGLFTDFSDERMINHFFEKFLDPSPENTYQTLREELKNVFSNDDGTGARLFPTPGNTRTISIAACTVVLASPYITLVD
jgi:hypothetical protein